MSRLIRLIIPAAGAGTRMGLTYPKTLFPVAGKPILWHILAATEGLVDASRIVVSPSGIPAIQEFLAATLWRHAQTVVQEKPIGMADAVWVGLNAFDDAASCDYLIIWGDHVTVRRETLAQVIAHHRATGAAITFPTSRRESPYIHIERDQSGRVRNVLEAREGDSLPSEGESDCGVFLARGEWLRQGLSDLRARTIDPTRQRFGRLDGRTSATGEFNFLPLITLWAEQGKLVQAVCVAMLKETRGINTQQEARDVEQLIQ